ncbi:ribonuclease P protein component [Ideonella sp. 4Y11]|uniref:Ribonuclease P protein component n=1 Tax=Ideonella aquatica TaxID=2824119 RepID=A0A941BMD8_9BURK|nr:ribonuclease P protein component [Ideonella aquatica]MBQ0961918.1 ribonuclease P protein component [Ideonella aquatica]
MDVGRIVRPADFERVLGTSPRSRSAHFAVHHVPGGPSRARGARTSDTDAPLVPGLSPELSTGDAPAGCAPVDDRRCWLGLVVPKRHARRAVTRNLIKRQLRAAMGRYATTLPGGLWVVRLRSPFDKAAFPSPGSDALRAAAHAEIEQLFHQAAHAPLAAQPRRDRSPRRRPA